MKIHHMITLLILATLLSACAPPFIASPTVALAPVQVGTTTFTPTSPPEPTFTASPTLSISSPVPATSSPAPTAAFPTVTLPPTIPALPLIVVGLSVGQTVSFASCAGTNPVQFNGTITVNSSSIVQYDWLLRGHATYNSPSQKANFQAPGTKKMFSQTSYKASCGSYTISLHIIYPNHMIATKYFLVH